MIQAQQPKAWVSRCGYHLYDVLQNGELDLARLLVGSEGTLALITQATLRTVPIPKHRGVAPVVLRPAGIRGHGGDRGAVARPGGVRLDRPPHPVAGPRYRRALCPRHSARRRSHADDRAASRRRAAGDREPAASGHSVAAAEAAGVWLSHGAWPPKSSMPFAAWHAASRRRSIACKAPSGRRRLSKTSPFRREAAARFSRAAAKRPQERTTSRRRSSPMPGTANCTSGRF